MPNVLGLTLNISLLGQCPMCWGWHSTLVYSVCTILTLLTYLLSEILSQKLGRVGVETHSFARASLSTSHQVAATQDHRNCPLLYWRRLVIVRLPYVLFQHITNVGSHETVTEHITNKLVSQHQSTKHHTHIHKHPLSISLLSHSMSLSLRFHGQFPGGSGLTGTRMSPIWILSLLRVTEMVVTIGAIRRAKLGQRNHNHQQTNTQCFTGQLSVPITQPTV